MSSAGTNNLLIRIPVSYHLRNSVLAQLPFRNSFNMALATVIRSSLSHSAIRHFSARAPEPTSRTQQAIATSLITSAVLLPFIPPALESRRERSLGHPNARKHQTPLCFHCN